MSTRPAHAQPTRELLLDSLETLLLSGGSSAATLEAVASTAGVSKGGLLYHFGSKEALYQGFLDRMVVRSRAEAAQILDAPQGVVAAYLDASSVADDPSTRTVLAALRLAGVPEVDVEAALAESFSFWYETIARRIDDPVLARMVQLVGDGFYLHALIGSGSDHDTAVVERVVSLVADWQRDAS
ncbi:TetR/AcrR family transcriptional regulator [Sanguibacter antarcticus]|uniref:TetR family transcriptional regulator n=1 Tax=Sanguibacter antarcticus TaxID=372484 RepID=A0A2A9E9M4_9MICO|nr:TetR/AcrR family transcriptional regulator [Sanguibacter antarcticus]PFG34952.1 TetR family transcriptional regulator [Sanguibacter antarcticus]